MYTVKREIFVAKNFRRFCGLTNIRKNFIRELGIFAVLSRDSGQHLQNFICEFSFLEPSAKISRYMVCHCQMCCVDSTGNKFPVRSEYHSYSCHCTGLCCTALESSLVPIQACKFALRRLGPLMGSKKINDLFQKNLDEGSTLLYGEFLNSFCKLMVSIQYYYGVLRFTMVYFC